MNGEFNELIHSPVRLRICGILRNVEELEFAVLRDTLGLNDANLSKNVKALTDAGFTNARKERSATRSDSRRLTWVSLSPAGRRVLESHLRALAAIANAVPNLPA